MELLGSSDDENIEAQHTTKRPTCAYHILNDETKAEEFFSRYPEDLEELDEDSPQVEEIMGEPICERPSCLLNLRIVVCYMLRPSDPEAVQDIDWAVPPDCGWRNASGIQSERDR